MAKNMQEWITELTHLSAYDALRVKIRKIDGSSELRKWQVRDVLPVGEESKSGTEVIHPGEGQTPWEVVEGVLETLDPGLYDVSVFSRNADLYLNTKRASCTGLLVTDGRLLAASGEAANAAMIQSLWQQNTSLQQGLLESQKANATVTKAAQETLITTLNTVKGMAETMKFIAGTMTEINTIQLQMNQSVIELQQKAQKAEAKPTILDSVAEGVSDAARGAAEQVASMVIGKIIAEGMSSMGGGE